MSLESKAAQLKQINSERLLRSAESMDDCARKAVGAIDSDIDINEALKMFQKWNISQEKFWFWFFEALKDE